MANRVRFTRVGQSTVQSDIDTIRLELTQAINSLQGDAFTSLRAQLTENLKGIDELIQQRTQLIDQRANAASEINKINAEITTLETQKATVEKVGQQFNTAVTKLRNTLNVGAQ